MRQLGLAVLVLSVSPALAQTGSLTDAIVPLLPGLSVRLVREAPSIVNGADQCYFQSPAIWECVGSPAFPPAWTTYGAFTIGFDAAGNAYHVANAGGSVGFGDGTSGVLLRRVSPDGVMEDVAGLRKGVTLADGTQRRFSPTGGIVDATNGRIWILVNASTYDAVHFQPPLSTPTTVGTVEIGGLPTMFDVLLTFVPSGQTLSALMPAHPDGFRAADSLQVWTGSVRSLPDWSQAQPLACTAATNPAPGQLVTVADTLPDPEVGQGRYYITASQSGAQRRLGRQFVGGAFVARDPSALPVCAQ